MSELGGLPPLAPLWRVAEALVCAEIPFALGGSGLLASLGLSDRAADWDLTTDAPLDTVVSAVRDVPHTQEGPDGIHADHKLRLEGGVVELIVGFAMRVETRKHDAPIATETAHGTSAAESIVRLPTIACGRWNDVPTGSPEVWGVAYHLLGRIEKTRIVFDWLERHGVRADVRRRMLEEPLPEELRRRLAALPEGR